MIIASIVTILCVVFFRLAKSVNEIKMETESIRGACQKSLEKPFRKEAIFLFTFLFFWIILPLVWGLFFYLKSDANVVVVIATIFWGYYNIKYLFPIQPEEE